jgi:hypothetical protein
MLIRLGDFGFDSVPATLDVDDEDGVILFISSSNLRF